MSSPVPTYERSPAALGAPAPRAFTGDDQPPVLALRPEEQRLWAMVEATFTAVRP
ncbi:hypothetical protein [Gordonia jinhuaensis]|uniref:hypothetical protein n=1 Tax=Gordonia jinhuaensis TaxID=1517702 RepID=UPI00166965B3|nr:hypothetical protein [Gordonia jinhuaensis]